LFSGLRFCVLTCPWRPTAQHYGPETAAPTRSLYILSRIPGMVGVTNNSTRVRTGYRIYSLWRFTAAHIKITVSTIALVASRIPLTELHCTGVSLRGLTA
jgi:hypothetical protein